MMVDSSRVARSPRDRGDRRVLFLGRYAAGCAATNASHCLENALGLHKALDLRLEAMTRGFHHEIGQHGVNNMVIVVNDGD